MLSLKIEVDEIKQMEKPNMERDFEPLLYKMLEKSGMWSPEKCKDFTSQISAGNTHVSDTYRAMYLDPNYRT